MAASFMVNGIVFSIINCFGILFVKVKIRVGRLLQTLVLSGEEVQLSSSCPIRTSHQASDNALIGLYTPGLYVKLEV